MSTQRAKLVEATVSVAVHKGFLALAFVALAFSHGGWWVALDVLLAAGFAVDGIKEYSRGRAMWEES